MVNQLELEVRRAQHHIIPEKLHEAQFCDAYLYYGVSSGGEDLYCLIPIPQQLSKQEGKQLLEDSLISLNDQDILLDAKPIAQASLQFSNGENGRPHVRMIRNNLSFGENLIESFLKAEKYQFS